MERRLGFCVSSVGGLLAVALVAAPVWDFWRYRSLRAPLGPHVPVGVILPLRTLPPPPASAPTRGTTLASLSPSHDSSERAALAAPRPERTPGIVIPPTAPVVLAGFAAPGSAPHAVPVPRPGENAPARAAVSLDNRPETAAGPPSSEAPTAEDAPAVPGLGTYVAGWPAPPARDQEPQLPPEPQQGPPPPPSTVPPKDTPAEPTPATQAIPTLTLTPPGGTVKVGDAFTVTVRLTTGRSVSSLPFHVAFDPAVLQFQSAERGSAIGASMQTILLASVSPARPGDLAVGLSLVDSGPMLRNSGTVLRLNFLALAPGSSALTFDRASIRGNMSEPLDAQFHDTRIDVH